MSESTVQPAMMFDYEKVPHNSFFTKSSNLTEFEEELMILGGQNYGKKRYKPFPIINDEGQYVEQKLHRGISLKRRDDVSESQKISLETKLQDISIQSKNHHQLLTIKTDLKKEPYHDLFFAILESINQKGKISDEDKKNFHDQINSPPFPQNERTKLHNYVDFLILVNISNTRKLTSEEKETMQILSKDFNAPSHLKQKLNQIIEETL
jgi:hypothetical protein